MSTSAADRIARLIATTQTAIARYDQDRMIPVADLAALKAALAEIVDPAGVFADLTPYSDALADADIDPLTHALAAIRYLRYEAQITSSLVLAKQIVDELNVRTIVAYIVDTGAIDPGDIAYGLGISPYFKLIAEARERALLADALS